MSSLSLSKGGLFSGAAIYLVASLFNAAIPFLLLPLLTRYLDPEEYGQVAMFQVLISGLAAFVGLNTVGAANRRFFDHDGTEGTPTFLGSCLVILFWSFLATFLACLALLPYLSDFLGLSPIWILLAPISAAAMFVVNLRLGQWRVRQQPIPFGSLQIAMSLFNAGLSIALVVYLAYGAAGRMAGQFTAPAVFSLIALGLLYRDGLLRFTYSKTQIREALRFGVPLIPHVLGAFLLFSVDRLIINQQLGLADAGIYMVGVQISMGVSICVDAFNKAYSPWLMGQLRKNDSKTDRKIVRFTYLYFMAAIVVASLCFWIGPSVIYLIAGAKYKSAGDVVGFLLAGQCVRGMYQMIVNYILYSRKTGRLSLLTTTSGALNIGLMLIFIPSFGLIGAGYAFLLSSSLLFFGGWSIAAKAHPMPWILR